MIRSIIKQDALLSSWRLMTAILLGNSMMLGSILFAITGPFSHEWPPYLPDMETIWCLLIALMLVILLSVPIMRHRCGSLLLTLPISARHIWLAHLATVVFWLTGAMMLIFAIAAIMVTLLPTEIGSQRMMTSADLLAPGVYLYCGLLLVVTWLQCLQPQLHQVRFSRYFCAHLTGALILLTGFVWLNEHLPLWFAFMPLPAVYLLARQTYKSIPLQFTLAPRDAARNEDTGPDPAVSQADWSARREQAKPGWKRQLNIAAMVWRLIYDRWSRQFLLAAPWLFFFGMILEGTLFNDDETQYTMPFMAAYLLFVFSRLVIRRLSRFDPLPISRRLIFGLIVWPFSLCLGAGYLTGYLVTEFKSDPGELVFFEIAPECRPDSVLGVALLPRYFEIDMDGKVEDIVSPWGETTTPRILSPIKGLPVVIYKPYSTDGASSEAFIAWQLSRAVQTIYGDSIAPADLAENYLTSNDPDAGRPVTGKHESLTLAADYPELSPVHYGHGAPGIFLVIGVLLLITLQMNFRIMRGYSSVKRVNVAFVVSLVLLLGLHVGQYVMDIIGVFDFVLIGAFWKIALRNLYLAVPGGNVSLWLVSLLLIGLVYRWVERGFAGVESVYTDVKESSCWWRISDR